MIVNTFFRNEIRKKTNILNFVKNKFSFLKLKSACFYKKKTDCAFFYCNLDKINFFLVLIEIL